MTRDLRPGKTETYEFVITGLLGKRQSMVTESERLKERLAEIKNDIGTIDRTLDMIGFKGDLVGMSPKRSRQPIFERGELVKAVLEALRAAGRPMKSRDIATAVAIACGDDPKDRRYITELTRRIGRAISPLMSDGLVHATADHHGTRIWRLAK